jgi:hypothetical protein
MYIYSELQDSSGEYTILSIGKYKQEASRFLLMNRNNFFIACGDSIEEAEQFAIQFGLKVNQQDSDELVQDTVKELKSMTPEEHFPEISSYLETIQKATRDYETFLKSKGYVLVSLLLEFDLYYFAVHKDYIQSLYWKDLVYESKKYLVGAILHIDISTPILTTVDLRAF